VVEWAPLVSDTIRIITWNVHGTFNLNPHFDLDGVCAIIEKWAPDIVALQEVDSRGRSDDVFGRLADSVGEHRVEARSIIAEDGHYGQVLLSRWPFAAEPKITDVSYQEREPRRAISARVRLPIGEVTVIATHLGLSIHERYAQARALVDLIDPPCAGVALPGANAIAHVSVPVSRSAARPHLHHAGRKDPQGMGRP
jgi:endonuclease/exonuclease/phosphatase family metal-dependent hydrolase